MKIYKTIIKALFPNVCVGCGKVISENDFLCEYCHEMIERTYNKLCIKCGENKKHCVCRKRVFCFDGITSPFYNKGISQRCMYSFKLSGKKFIGRFFAEQMALSVKQNFPCVKFDLIAFVPMSSSLKRQKIYNQSEVLAEELSKILGIPIFHNLLGSKKKKRGQYTLSLKARFDNVRGIYYTNFIIDGKVVLLVDDIKTTGATLSECSKQLISAGASRVYCVTGVVTDNRKGKSDDN